MKEIIKLPDSVSTTRNSRAKPSTSIAKLQPDPRSRISSSVMHSISLNSTPVKNKNSSGGFMTLGPRKKLQKALMKINIFPKANHFS